MSLQIQDIFQGKKKKEDGLNSGSGQNINKRKTNSTQYGPARLRWVGVPTVTIPRRTPVVSWGFSQRCRSRAACGAVQCPGGEAAAVSRAPRSALAPQPSSRSAANPRYLSGGSLWRAFVLRRWAVVLWTLGYNSSCRLCWGEPNSRYLKGEKSLFLCLATCPHLIHSPFAR